MEIDAHWDVKMVWFWYSWEVKMVWFWSLVRSQDGMVLIPREKSRWYGLDPSWEVKMVWFDPSWGVEIVWFWSLVRSQDGMVWIPREKSRWYGFGPSWGVWSDWPTSWDVGGCVTIFQKDCMVWIPREKLVWFWFLVRSRLLVASLVRRNQTLTWLSLKSIEAASSSNGHLFH